MLDSFFCRNRVLGMDKQGTPAGNGEQQIARTYGAWLQSSTQPTGHFTC